MKSWLFAASCVLFPALWGVVMYLLFGLVERRRQRRVTRDTPPPIDYSI